jgi:AAA15 family ATPase/GTPase
LKSIFEFFEKLVIRTDITTETPFLLEKGTDFDPRILRFLSQADVGIVSHNVSEHKGDSDPKRKQFMDDLNVIMKRYISDENFTGIDDVLDKYREVTLGHRGSDDRVVFLPYRSESRGTRRLMSLLQPIYSALDDGGIVVIDELDASLHTYICMELVRLFGSEIHNVKGAQLLATTHDTNILSHSMVRKDQIWLTEKDELGSSIIYPLSDFKIKKTDNMERGYLRGRYGGVPPKLHH